MVRGGIDVLGRQQLRQYYGKAANPVNKQMPHAKRTAYSRRELNRANPTLGVLVTGANDTNSLVVRKRRWSQLRYECRGYMKVFKAPGPKNKE